MISLYIGFDLGDGESIISYLLVTDAKQINKPELLILPTRQVAGQSIPTAYIINDSGSIILGANVYDPEETNSVFVANFKKQPSSFFRKMTEYEYDKLLSAFISEAPAWPQLDLANIPELIDMRDKIKTFTDTLFSLISKDDKFITLTNGIDRIVFCVGHPTRWRVDGKKTLDIAIYKKILQQTIIGQPTFSVGNTVYNSEFLLDSESRAAFLYARKIFADVPDQEWIMDKSRLLIDIGSSTIDLTAFRKTSLGGGSYNIGHNFLGARILDYLLLDLFLEKLPQDERESLEMYISKKPEMLKMVLLQCRKTKESIYTGLNNPQNEGKVIKRKISFEIDSDEFSAKITSDDMIILENADVSPVVDKYLDFPEKVRIYFKNKSWRMLFHDFIAEQAEYFYDNDYALEEVFLTGSASQMPFVTQICRDIFDKSVSILYDINPAVAIASGLTLIGASHEKSKDFRNSINNYMDKKLPSTIDKYFPNFIKRISESATNIILSNIVMPALKEWRDDKDMTINELTTYMQNSCTSQKFMEYLRNDKGYISDMEKWNKKLMKNIDKDLDDLCQSYQTSVQKADMNNDEIPRFGNITLPELNIEKDVSAPIEGIITIIPIIIIYVIAVAVVVIFNIANPIVALGAKLICDDVDDGIESIKRNLNESISNAGLPKIAKIPLYVKAVSTIKNKHDEIEHNVKTALCQKETKENIINSIRDNLRSQIETAIRHIEYIIEG